jgi:hypothetical protein
MRPSGQREWTMMEAVQLLPLAQPLLSAAGASLLRPLQAAEDARNPTSALLIQLCRSLQ